MGLRFKPSAEQAAKLERLLSDQQNPSSARYHAWLTPEEYADQFGLSDSDLAHVSQWLASQGFHVEATGHSRTWISFSGTAEQVLSTFKTEVHRFRANGQLHFANVAAAQIPAPLEPLVDNLDGLSDLGPAATELKPRVASDEGNHGLAPNDLAAIYNTQPLLQKGFDGSGQKIAVIGASAINLSDIQRFRDRFGLPANDPQLILAPGAPDPGKTGFYHQAVSDVKIAGASAPKASIIYVYSGSPFRAAQYAIDQNLAPVITYTYDTCEKICHLPTGMPHERWRNRPMRRASRGSRPQETAAQPDARSSSGTPPVNPDPG
jgi:subtilase family serine protease